MKIRGPKQNLVGQRFGLLTVTEWAGLSRWVCACNCGRSSTVLTANLRRGNTGSCGCVRNQQSNKRATKHGLYGTQVYRAWAGIKRRCFEESHPSYSAYGGAGITMSPEWKADPVAFAEHLGPPPSRQHSIDRIDNLKGYVPGNVRWADGKTQSRNRRNVRRVVWNGRDLSFPEFIEAVAKQAGLSPRTVKQGFDDYSRRRQ